MSDITVSPVEVIVEADGWAAALGADPAEFSERIVAAAATAEAREGAVAVLLADDCALADLNRQWRGKDGPTNVLSFPAAPAPYGPLQLGDIAVALETVSKEAATQGKTVEAHLAHLLVHGFLHLLGYDHEDETDAVAMESREREILAALGYGDPYDVAVDAAAAR